MDIWRSLQLIRSQFLLFVVATVVAFVAILVGPSFAAKKSAVYKSAAKILITPHTEDVRIVGERSSNAISWFSDEATLKTLLSSQDLLDLVIETAGMKMAWTDLRQRIQLDVLSEGGKQVSLLEIAVFGSAPEEARLLALTISDKFIQYVQQLSTAEHDKTVAFLERERRNAEREVARAQKKLLSIGILPRNTNHQDPLEVAWTSLQTKRAELERDKALAEAEVEQLDVSVEDGVSLGSEGVGTDLLDSAVAKERLKLEELQEVYTDRSPQVQSQREKLRRAEALAQRQFSHLVNSRREAAKRKRDKIATLLAGTEQRLQQLEAKRPTAEKHLEYATQERQLSMWQENYLDLTRQLYRARVAQQSSRRDGAFTIVEKPQPGIAVAGTQVSDSPLGRVLMGIPLSLFCGLAAVMLADYLTASMRLHPRIEEALGLPIIGTIPSLPNQMVANWDTMKSQVRKSKLNV
jgi:capsular polysaccharide biosynthesis protein